MVNEEIYLLTKHGKFDSNYLENIPIYKRRFFLHLLHDEFEKIEEKNNKIINNNKRS